METVLAGEKVASFPSPVTCTLGEEVGMAGKRKTVLDKAYPKAAYTSERKQMEKMQDEG